MKEWNHCTWIFLKNRSSEDIGTVYGLFEAFGTYDDKMDNYGTKKKLLEPTE